MKQTTTGIFSPDPLQHGVSLELGRTFYPLGFPVRIETNDPRILEAAEQSWRTCERRFDRLPVQIRIAVSQDNSTVVPAAPVFRGQKHLMTIVSDAANFAVCDFSAGFCFCWLGAAAAGAKAWARYHFTEAMAYATLTHLYLTAVHAGSVARNGRGVLLCGPSGIGKSVLTFACARNGWTFVSDDVSFLLRERPGADVIGRSERLKLLVSGAELFPGTNLGLRRADQNGYPFVDVSTKETGISTAQECSVHRIVFLRRPVAGPPTFTPVDAEEAFARMVGEIPVYEESVRQAQLESLKSLSRLPAVELAYESLDEAVRMLNRLVEGSA